MNETRASPEHAREHMQRRPVPPRLYAVLARNASVGIIFSRTPSRWVHIIKWHTHNDTFEPGHWFHGRIYETRSDVSPDGSKLLYFALRIRPGRQLGGKPQVAWTAISKPPWLTALALWPRHDTYGGGGLFLDDHTIWLDHLPQDAEAEEHHKPEGIDITLDCPVSEEPGRIYSKWLHWRGWIVSAMSDYVVALTKAGPRGQGLIYTRRYAGRDMDREEYTLTAPGGVTIEVAAGPEGCVWADWDQQGRLVFAKVGKVFAGEVSESGLVTTTELADFNDAKPEAIKPPDWATKW